MPYFIEHFGEMSPLLRGFVVCSLLVPSAVTGILAGKVSDRISRKWTISLGCGIFATGGIISCSAPNLVALICARLISGAGEGLFLSASTVYLCETSPSHIRGRVISYYQLFITGALAAGFFVCYGSIKIPNSFSWRLPIMISTCVALTVAVLAPMLPYSPRWLVSQGRNEEAEQVLDLVMGPKGVVTESTSEYDKERQELLAVPRGNQSGWSDIFKKGVRGRTLLGVHLNVFQMLSGIDFVLFYAPLLFAQAGLDPQTSSFIASGVTGLLIFAITGCATFYVDKIGRRALILGGGVCGTICHLCIGSLYASGGAYTPVGKYSVIVLIEVFAVTFAGSWATIVRLYASEIQPSTTRSAANSFGQGLNQGFNTVIALTSPAFLARSPSGPYFLYGSLFGLGTLIAFVYMPETLHQSLENIENTFSGPSVAVPVRWPAIPSLLGLPNQSKSLRQRRPSNRRLSAALEDAQRTLSPQRIGMQRLGSSAYTGSAIDEDDEE